MKKGKNKLEGNLTIIELKEKPTLGIEPFELAAERFLFKRERKLIRVISDRVGKNSTHGVPEEWVEELNAIREYRKEMIEEKNAEFRKKMKPALSNLAFAVNLGGFPFIQHVAEMLKMSQDADEEAKKKREQSHVVVDDVENQNQKNESSTVSTGK